FVGANCFDFPSVSFPATCRRLLLPPAAPVLLAGFWFPIVLSVST
ncbi:hypothetical protein SLEP1_g60430, partial [Rubroshorea leprosula]